MKSYKGYNQTFKTDFTSPSIVAKEGGVVGASATVQGKFKGDGSANSHVAYDRGFEFIYGNTWSVRIKFKANTLPAVGLLLAKDVATSRSFIMGFLDTGLPWFYVLSPSTLSFAPSGTTPIIVGKIYDMVITMGASGALMYMNGVVNGTAGAQRTVVRGSTASPRIGGREYVGNEQAWDGEIYSVETFQGVELTPEEVKDLYEQDTCQEIEQPLIDLPLRSSYYKANGVELIVGSNMELANWTATNNAALSNPETGVLRVTRDGTNNPQVHQTILTSAKRYKITVDVKSDGNATPTFYVGGVAVGFSGTTSTSWQSLSWEGAADGSAFYMRATTSTGTQYCEFRNATVELMEAQTENKGTLGGTAKLGNGTTTTTFPTQLSPHGMSFDGANDILQIAHADVPDFGNNFTVWALVRFNIIPVAADALIDKSSGGAALSAPYMIWLSTTNLIGYIGNGAAVNSAAAPILPTAGKVHFVAFTCNDDNLIMYLDGIAGTPTNRTIESTNNALPLIFGAGNAAGTIAIGAKIYNAGVENYAMTPSQVRIKNHKMMKLLNV